MVGRESGLFILAATALLGSPGPGIVSLIAVGKSAGLTRGLHYYAGLQVGLATAAALSGAGLITILMNFPFVARAMTTVATAYLVYLAFAIATSAVGVANYKPLAASASAGILLGLTNPKSYLAFATLFASPLRLNSEPARNVAFKWLLCVGVMLIVDFLWLWGGVMMGRAQLTSTSERSLNITMGTTVLATAAYSFLADITG